MNYKAENSPQRPAEFSLLSKPWLRGTVPVAAAALPSGKLLRCHKPGEIMCSGAIVVLCYV